MRRTLLLAGAGLVLAAGIAGAGGARTGDDVSVQVHVTTYQVPEGLSASTGFLPSTQIYTLTCDPPGGSLPFAARVCEDIAANPQALLDPGQDRSVCGGYPGMPEVAIAATDNGTTNTFGDSPGCGWPGGIAAAFYFAAAEDDEQGLFMAEPGVHCADDPSLVVQPTPWTQINACQLDIWQNVSVDVQVSSASQQPQTFSLTCNPIGGTLPLADRVCADIGHAPAAMLDPAQPRSSCSGASGPPTVSVSASVTDGATTNFSGEAGCGWPLGDAPSVYAAAAANDDQGLQSAELPLHCAEDSALLVQPTPWALVDKCRSQPFDETYISLAKQVPALASLKLGRIFATEAAARTCLIPTLGSGKVPGKCSVSVTNVFTAPVVTFDEQWLTGLRYSHHTWQIAIQGQTVQLVKQSGPRPTQLSHHATFAGSPLEQFVH